jgi:tetratricopeptide (TPR) repeat protein
MIAFLPAFLVVLVWVKGVSFFNARFLMRMFLLGLAGLSFYLLLPLVNVFSQGTHVGFWQALHFNFAEQKRLLFLLPFSKQVLFQVDQPLWVLALPSLLPVLAMGVRWPAYFGDPSKLGIALATLFFHVVHGALLLLCCWVALDPIFSPRNYAPWLGFYGVLLLPFYYLGAFSIGYYSGYFLLVFGAKPVGRPRPIPNYLPWAKASAVGLVWLLLVLLPVALVYHNLPQLRSTYGPLLRQFVAFLQAGLPKHDTVVLGDDPTRLYLLESALTQSGAARNYFFLETGGSLNYPDYHRFLKRKYPRRWGSDPPKDHPQFYDDEIMMLVNQLAQSNSLYYLHPSFGYYFELFYPEPHGMIYQLKPYPANSLLAPLASDSLVTENEKFWTRVEETSLRQLSHSLATSASSANEQFWDLLLQRIYVKKQPNQEAAALGKFYSRALNFWGVELQKAGHLTNAALHFQRALDLNGENRVAQLNLACNRDLQAQRELWVDTSGSIEDRFGHFYSNWEQIMNINGPFDEPTMCYAQGRVFLQGRNFGQSAQQFARVQELVPGFLPARLLLAQLYLARHLPDQALKVAEQIKAQAKMLGLTQTNMPYLLAVEASAHLEKDDIGAADSVVARVLKQYPDDETLLWTAAQVYKSYGDKSLSEIVSRGAYLKAASTNQADQFAVRAADAVATSNTWQAAETALSTALRQYPTNFHLKRMSAQLHFTGDCYSNFLGKIEELLRTKPEDRNYLLQKGFAYIQLKEFERAAKPLTQILNLETNNAVEMQLYYNALLYRAYAALRSQKWDASQRDYESLQKAFPTGRDAYRIYLGLGEVALGKKDTNAAFRNYHFCLANVPTNSPEAETIRTRLADIKPPARR